MTFKKQILRGSLWSLFGNSGQQIISFVIFIYIARTVTPADVGLVALAMVLVNILAVFSRFGQVQVLQREIDLSELTINTSFWLLLGAGMLTTAAVFAAAQIVSWVSTETTLPGVIMLLAPLCALQSWNAVPEAVLRRRLNYRSLSFRSWMAALSGGLLGIFLAYRGYGVYALVAQRLASAAVQTLAAWTFLQWHPRLMFSWREAKRLSVVGGEIMLAGFANVLNVRVADGLTGFMLGATQLGYLRLGWRFQEVIQQVASNPVTNIALTAFAQAKQDRGSLQRRYLRLTQFMAGASLPLFFGLAATADIMVPVVFGSQWVESVIVLQMLCLLNLTSTVNSFFPPAMVAVGKSRLLLKQAIVQVFITVLFVAIGATMGIVGIMGAFIARGLIFAVYNVRQLDREISLAPYALLKILVPPLAASLVMVAAVDAAKIELHELAGITILAILLPIGAVTYGLALLMGDFCGLWRGYVRDAVGLLADASVHSDSRPSVTTPA